jgi:hypothetical protein
MFPSFQLEQMTRSSPKLPTNVAANAAKRKALLALKTTFEQKLASVKATKANIHESWAKYKTRYSYDIIQEKSSGVAPAACEFAHNQAAYEDMLTFMTWYYTSAANAISEEAALELKQEVAAVEAATDRNSFSACSVM